MGLVLVLHLMMASSNTAAIIVPYRNRSAHLERFSHRMKHFSNTTVFVIEQGNTGPFNRGWLLNIGIDIALKNGSYDCIVTHDVDMMPSPNVDYTHCTRFHRVCRYECTNLGTVYPTYAGGVIKGSRYAWKRVNGYTNLAFGWGGEDDILYERIRQSRLLPIQNADSAVCTCNNDKDHTKRITIPHHYQRTVSILKRMQRNSLEWMVDGLSSLDYKIKRGDIPNVVHYVATV